MIKNKVRAWFMFSIIALVVPFSAAHAAGWDSISVDEVKGEKDPYYGIGNGANKEEAEKTAQKFCADAGGKECQIMISYQQCGAYVAAKEYAGKGIGSTKKIAEDKAMTECNDKDCSLVVSDCVK